MKNRKIICIFFINAIFLLTFVLFYHYFIGSGEMSDFRQHLKLAWSGKSYSLLSVCLIILYNIFHSEISLAVFMSIIVCSTIVCVSCLIRELLVVFGIDYEIWSALLIAISSVFLCNIYIPKFSPYFYTFNAVSTQPWHNPTYLLMRLFGIYALLLYFKLDKKYQNVFTLKKAFTFTIMIVLTNASKPNFIIAFAPTMLLFLFIDFIITKGKTLRQAIKFGSCVLISLPILIVQSFILFPGTDDSGIAFNYQRISWEFIRMEVFDKAIVALAFPIFVTIIYLVISKKDVYALRILGQSWCMFIIARLEALYIVERGGACR